VQLLRETGPVVLLDNGNINKGYGRQPELKFETAMRAMADMGYVTANAGAQDLLLGRDYVNYVADFAKLPLVNANVMTSEGEPALRPFVMHDVQVGETALRVVITGIVSLRFEEDIARTNPDLVVEDYDTPLDRIIEDNCGPSDLLVVLAQMDEEEAATLAERFPRIDLLITSSEGDEPFHAPIVSGDVPIVFAGMRGMHLGLATFSVGAGRPAFSSFSARKLDDTLTDSPRMTESIEAYEQMLRAENLLEATPRTKHAQADFTGSQSCKRCHSLPSFRFRKSKHAHAFEALVQRRHEYDPECVGCHTVGFGYVTGFVSPETTPEFENVDCEACHGPGSVHIDKPMDIAYGDVPEQTCKTCHDGDNSPTFVYEERIAKIKHNSFFLCSARICHWLK
jgi:hypothetical protein